VWKRRGTETGEREGGEMVVVPGTDAPVSLSSPSPHTARAPSFRALSLSLTHHDVVVALAALVVDAGDAVDAAQGLVAVVDGEGRGARRESVCERG